MSDEQRAILQALADGWELLRWRCNDGAYRWHTGDGEVDGRSVRGLVARGLLVRGNDPELPSLILAGRTNGWSVRTRSG